MVHYSLAEHNDEIKAMDIMSNLTKIKDLDFDHCYILEHVNELGLQPTLCNHYCPLSKYFCTPEMYINDLYKWNSSFEFIEDFFKTINILPYKKLKALFCHFASTKMFSWNGSLNVISKKYRFERGI